MSFKIELNPSQGIMCRMVDLSDKRCLISLLCKMLDLAESWFYGGAALEWGIFDSQRVGG